MKVFITKFLTHVTKFVIHVRKFVTRITKFVINFFCAESENFQGERKKSLGADEK